MTSTRFYDAKSNNFSDMKLCIAAKSLPKVSQPRKMIHIKFSSNIRFPIILQYNEYRMQVITSYILFFR